MHDSGSEYSMLQVSWLSCVRQSAPLARSYVNVPAANNPSTWSQGTKIWSRQSYIVPVKQRAMASTISSTIEWQNSVAAVLLPMPEPPQPDPKDKTMNRANERGFSMGSSVTVNPRDGKRRRAYRRAMLLGKLPL